jgi:hypothetical protein
MAALRDFRKRSEMTTQDYFAATAGGVGKCKDWHELFDRESNKQLGRFSAAALVNKTRMSQLNSHPH